MIVVISAFVVYATWRAFEGKFYEWGPYLSPFYSPLIDPATSLVAVFAGDSDSWAGPLGFRVTCYYYRKAYYRAFRVASAGLRGERGRPARNYRGETTFPFILQNVHRYFFYVATIFVVLSVVRRNRRLPISTANSASASAR